MQNDNKYIQMAKELNMEHAVLIKPEDIFFDLRAVLKCRWGCEDFSRKTVKFGTRNTPFEEGLKMIKSYKDILMLHGRDGREMSKAVLEIERAAFLDG